MKLHPSITEDRIIAAVESQIFDLEDPGFCIRCGEDAFNVASGYPCEACGHKTVYGAQELMFHA